MKLIASDSGVKELTVDGSKPIKRQKDGAFHVPDSVGKAMIKGGEFGRVGMTFQNVQGYHCQDCGHLGIYRDKCKCGSTNLEAE